MTGTLLVLPQYNGRTYASFRVGVRFNSTNTTQVRDEMWNGVGSPGIAKPCSGGYNTILYKNVAALFAKHKFKVSQNSERRSPVMAGYTKL
jgi:hypothetical protein